MKHTTKSEAVKEAKELSIKHWNRYFFVYGGFSVGRYWSADVIETYLKGEIIK